MAYRELMKNYDNIRNYMRQFYVYGFKSREEYDAKSARSYDNERRRVESWLGEYMCFRQNATGKNVFLSVDSRSTLHNPLYQSFKAKSFTNKDITLHFYLLDLLQNGASLTCNQLVEQITKKYLSCFKKQDAFEESTVRKKLKEYVDLGIVVSEKQGREVRYHLPENTINRDSWMDAIAFFSEENPVGLVGSFLLDQFRQSPDYFYFKHHYILHAIDSDILCELLVHIREHRSVVLSLENLNSHKMSQQTIYPIKIYISTQTGRQYLVGYQYQTKQLILIRLDSIHKVKMGDFEPNAQNYINHYEKMKHHLWGVSIGVGRKVSHVEMTIYVGKNEPHIPKRLEREKRNGIVEQLDEHTYRYSTDTYDALEMLPWIRTFIGRIIELKSSNQQLVDTFYSDLEQMLQLYKGDSDAVS